MSSIVSHYDSNKSIMTTCVQIMRIYNKPGKMKSGQVWTIYEKGSGN
jgi:hypothetical protein